MVFCSSGFSESDAEYAEVHNQEDGSSETVAWARDVLYESFDVFKDLHVGILKWERPSATRVIEYVQKCVNGLTTVELATVRKMLKDCIHRQVVELYELHNRLKFLCE